jgi:hypothetical protein
MNLNYVAGIIDGEGYVSIDRNSAVGRCLVGKVVVQMSQSTIPKLLHKQFGGNYRTYKRNNPNQSDAHTWALNGSQARKFLKKIEALLIIKRKQARLVMALYDSKDKAKIRTYPSEARLAYQFRLYVRAKSLCTRKGPKGGKNHASIRNWKSR